MRAYILRRLGALVLTLLLISIIVFLVMRVLPGDPAQIILGTEADPALLAQMREKLGLNRPLPVQYGEWLKGVLTGDLGESITYNTPVAGLIASRLAVTGPLAALALLLTAVISIPLGIHAATHHNRLGDYGIMLFSQLGISIPEFWLGILLILLFAVYARWFPAGGFTEWAESPLGALRSLLLPALALGVVRAAIITRIARSSLLEVLGEDYVRTARSKGLPEGVVITKHALRNSLISVVTVLALQLGGLLAGTIIIESVFYLPGMGRLVILAIAQRDLPVVQGVVIFIAGVIILVNFLVDILYGFLDPRIRYD
ncbi:MAG: ABC transporter permease [Candidatus Acetothermia bacterium]|nr:ABC transporter permease [Candidatus Acetothermia bacterium]MDH7504822.1 ABC transporter permease [Candidatus Acetothermia bacterium]